MVKTISGKRQVRAAKIESDPVADQLVAANAKNILIGNIVTMGFRLGIMVLVPIFAGVQLDKRFDSAPSLTLAAFFIAIFGSSLLIYKTYAEMAAQTAESDKVKTKTRRLKRLKRSKNA